MKSLKTLTMAAVWIAIAAGANAQTAPSRASDVSPRTGPPVSAPRTADDAEHAPTRPMPTPASGAKGETPGKARMPASAALSGSAPSR